MGFALNMKAKGIHNQERGRFMSHRRDDKLRQTENFLNYIPYTKVANLQDEKYLEEFLSYIASKHSLLPEMAKVISTEELFNFLFAFSGQVIEVPDQKSMLAAFRDLDIYNSLVATPSFQEVQRLAAKYSVTTQTIKSASDRVAKTLHKDSPIK